MVREPGVDDLIKLLLDGHITRRHFLSSGLRLGISVGALGAILAACGGEAPSGGPGGKGGVLRAMSWGGGNDDARKKTIFPGYQSRFGTQIINVAQPIDYAKVKTQYDAGGFEFDIVFVAPSIFYTLGPSYFEKIDYKRNPEVWRNVVPSLMLEYAAPIFISAEPIIYRTDVFPAGQGPQSWADFWDTKRFPGKRALGADGGVPWFTFECALMAAGASPDEVYPIDFDAALESLDKLRATGDLLIWSSNAEAAEMLASGQVVMARNEIGSIRDALLSGELAITWQNTIAWWESIEIFKGTPNFEQAMNLIDFYVEPEQQAAYNVESNTGPVNNDARDLIPDQVAALLPVPPEYLDGALWQDFQWYGDNYSKMVEEWTKWSAG